LDFLFNHWKTSFKGCSTADYYILISNRLYGALSNLPGQYPESSKFHDLLFSRDLGFELDYTNIRYNNINGYNSNQNRFQNIHPPQLFADSLPFLFGPIDESVTVYDQPLVLIFENKENYNYELMKSLFSEKE
jgi:hypothetical protein